MTAIVQIGDAIINANTLICDFQTITHAMTQQSCTKKKHATQLQLKHGSFTMVMVYVYRVWSCKFQMFRRIVDKFANFLSDFMHAEVTINPQEHT